MYQYLPYFAGFDVLVLIVMCGIVLNNRTLSKRQKIRFIITFVLISIITIIECCLQQIEMPEPNAQGIHELMIQYRTLDIAFNNIAFAMSPLIGIMFAYASSPRKQKIYPWICYAVWLLIYIILSSCQLVFKLDPITGEYQRQGAYFIIVLGYVCSTLYLLIETIIVSSSMQFSNTYMLYIIYILFIGGSSIQLALPDVTITWTVATVSVVLYYTYFSNMWQQIDELTGLLSQGTYIKQTQMMKPDQILIILDIDDFKGVNDNFGHTYGDNVLVKVSKCIKQVYKKYGHVYRIGGDEFAVIVKPETNVEELNNSLFKMIDRLREEDPRMPSISAGYASYKDGMYANEIKDSADKSMYKSKQKRKNKKALNVDVKE